MTEFVSIYANGDKGKVVTVTAAFAEGIGAKVLDDVPALDTRGRPLPARDRPKTSGSKSATVDEVLAAVGDDQEKAAAALAEETAGKNRKTLVEALTAIVDGDTTEEAS